MFCCRGEVDHKTELNVNHLTDGRTILEYKTFPGKENSNIENQSENEYMKVYE